MPLKKSIITTAILVLALGTYASAKTGAEQAAAFQSNVAAAQATSAWTQCGGAPNPHTLTEFAAFLSTTVCYSKTNPEMAADILGGLDTLAQATQNDAYAQIEPQVHLAQMKVAVQAGDRMKAARLYSALAVTSQHRWDGGSLPEEQAIYYNMLTLDMQKVLLAHGGTMMDNRDARPQDWKGNGPGVDLWVYKSGGAVVTTYIFTNGKLTQTLKP